MPLGTIAKLHLFAFVRRGNGLNRSKAVLRESNDEAIEQCEGKGRDESYATSLGRGVHALDGSAAR